jgi:hypothetical protein
LRRAAVSPKKPKSQSAAAINQMNKASLLTSGKRLNDSKLYFLSVHDLEPSGIIIHAYDQLDSKEYILPVTEHEVTGSCPTCAR